MTTTELLGHWTSLKNRFPELSGWTLGINSNKTRLGVCKHYKKRIEIADYHLSGSEDAAVLDTLLHEVAHVLAGYGNGHNHIWREKCRLIGANPETCANHKTFELAKPNYLYHSNPCSCGMIHKKHRLRFSSYRCIRCKTTLIFNKTR